MYVKISYDGRIESTSASGGKRVGDRVSLDGYCELVVEIPGGPISYYDNSHYDTLSRGKIKSIGSTQIKYFDELCADFCKSKVEKIGDIDVWYYDREAGPASRGKIKYINDILVEYYDSSFPPYKAGKPKQVGNVAITIL